MPRRLMSATCLAALLAAPAGAAAPALSAAASGAPELCLGAADRAALRHGIPAQMMRAITLVETRRTVDGATGPWPWTLNIGGQGYWHGSRAEALAHAEREMAQGKRSIDVGCFQLNYRWHGANFSGPDDMLDPALAADYAARFLADLYAETGDWMRAAGLYHSRTPVHSSRYRGLVERTLARLGTTPEALASLDAARLTAAPPSGPPVAAADAHSDAGPRLAAGITKDAAALVRQPRRAEAAAVSPALPGAVALNFFASPARPLLQSAAVLR